MMGKEQFVGTWRLISSEFRRTSDGEVTFPLGKDATGLIMYDAFGNMSVHIMKLDRPKFATNDRSSGTLEQTKAAYGGYIAYYGTIEVDEKEHKVIHHAEGSLFPNEVGRPLIRYYEFKDDLLILNTPVLSMAGEKVIGVLTWKRVKPAGEKRPKKS